MNYMNNTWKRVKNYLKNPAGSHTISTREDSTQLQPGMQVEVILNSNAPESLQRKLLRKTEGRITRVDQREGLGTKFYLHNAEQHFQLKFYTVKQL